MESKSRMGWLPPGILVILAGLLQSSTGCSSSQLSNMWKDPSFQNSPMTNMLIVAVKKDPVRRRLWEDGLVTELAVHGVAATRSYSLFPDAIPDTEQIVGAIKGNKYDGVLVVLQLPTESSTHDVAGYVVRMPEIRYSAWTQSYHTVYRQVEEGAYSDTERVVRHEIDVWTTTASGHLVWSATGETIDPRAPGAVRNEITGLVVPELARQGIIPAK